MKKLRRMLAFMLVCIMAITMMVGCDDSSASDDAEYIEASIDEETVADGAEDQVHYYFRNGQLLKQHYEKHGIEMGYSSAEEYEEAACQVANNPNALHKTEKEDGDDVYYLEETNEFVIVSTDGFIRTYFLPSKGLDYYNRQ